MLRRMSALAVSTVVAGGLLLAAAPAQAAPAATQSGVQAVAAAGSVTVNIQELRQQVAKLRQQAATLRHVGLYREADKVDARANAIEAQIKRYLDCERSVHC
ncbi:hypothetical protein GCM10010505_38130 [Kitasatospora aburaviensis]